MPFRDFQPGEVLTAAIVDEYLMSQVIIRCTTATRPPSPSEGWHIYETDTQQFMVFKSGSWQVQGGSSSSAEVEIVRKTADQIVNNSITLVNDNHLFFAVEANAEYAVEAFLLAKGSSSANFRLGWSGPVGSTFDWTLNSIPQDQASGQMGQIWRAGDGIGGVGGARCIDTGTNAIVLPVGTLAVGGTSGTFRFRFAQFTAHASNLTLSTNSWLRLTRIS